VTENGSAIQAAGSLGAFQGATGASWFYDGQTVYVKAPAASGTDSIVISFSTVERRHDAADRARNAGGHGRRHHHGDDRLDALVGQRCGHPLRRQPERHRGRLGCPAGIGEPELRG